MIRRSLVFILQISLFFLFPLFPQKAEGGSVLSLQQIDLLINTAAYNEALEELTKYLEAYPEDFDRAQKRISRIMEMREVYNSEAEKLVDIIKNGDESKNEKLMKIVELESSEQEPTLTVIDFTNLARRTVTMGEILTQYNRIMREGLALVREESYASAAVKFEEGFSIASESSDKVYDKERTSLDDAGVSVVYGSDITLPVRRSVNNIRSHIAGGLNSASMDRRISACEQAYKEYMQTLALEDSVQVGTALKKVKSTFASLAALRNSIIDEIKVLDAADKLANERNPLLFGTSYISFYEKFILGDEMNPDTGIIGAFDAYFNKRVESMKSGTNELLFKKLDSVIENLPESKIYALSDKIPAELASVSVAKNYASYSRDLHGLYALEKKADGGSVADKYSGYASSLDFVNEYISDLALAYESVVQLAYERGLPEKLDVNDFNKDVLDSNYARLLRYEKIKENSRNYLALVEKEKASEQRAAEEKAEREKEEAELAAASGGHLSLKNVKRRTSAGVQISDDRLDFRKQIAYFSSVNTQNLKEASSHARKLWPYFATVYAALAEKSFDYYEKKCSDTEVLLYGLVKTDDNQETDDFTAEFIKKYPLEAKANAEKLNEEIAKKKSELVAQRKILEGGEEYRGQEADFNRGTVRLDQIIHNFDSLFARNYAVINIAEPQIRQYTALLAQAEEQYKRAESAFRKEDFDAANAAVDSASEKYAAALDIEYSEKIRAMREDTLNALAVKIQQAEYAKVLAEVFDLKGKATTLYYSSNFDGAENLLTSAQAKWAKVSIEPDSEIENLLTIVKTVKSATYGRVLLQSDPHYPELSYSLDIARQSFERGVNLKKQGQVGEANEAFALAGTNTQNVLNVYPLNKEARLLNLKIQQERDTEKFNREFNSMYEAAKAKANKRERLADLEDLYEINPRYPGLSQEIYDIKDSLGMFPKKEVKKEVKKSADSKIAEARRVFNAAGNDEAKLNRALALADEAIAIDGTSKAAKDLKFAIQLKIGSTATQILSQADEKMYAEAARQFNMRNFERSMEIIKRLMGNSVPAKKSRKVIDLYNRLLKRGVK